VRSAKVGHADRLTATRVVGHRDHHQRNARRTRECSFEGDEVDVPLERTERPRIAGFDAGQIQCNGAAVLDVGTRSVEVRVVRNDVAAGADRGKEDPFCRASLVCRQDVPETGDVMHRLLECKERPGAGVRLIALHHRGPLVHGQRPRSRIGQEVDQDIARAQLKGVVMRGTQCVLTLFTCVLAYGLDGADTERLDDRVRWVHGEKCRPVLSIVLSELC
jgi:hypothetical protein